MSESGNPLGDVNKTIRSCLEAFVPASRLNDLGDSAPLITGGILDSITLVELVGALEERFGVKIQTHEMSVDHFDSIGDIAALVLAKLSESDA